MSRRAPVAASLIRTLASFALLSLGALAVAGCGKAAAAAGGPATTRAATSSISLVIVAQKPGSRIQGPTYMPSTLLTVPAHTLVTVSITNEDLGDTPLPSGSPFAQVSGVHGGVASVDGTPYHALANDKVAHTFTIPSLGINVPIPGDAPAGHQGVHVSFSFMTGVAGTYRWQCFDPCGSGTGGWGGPMQTMNYMIGTITVQ